MNPLRLPPALLALSPGNLTPAEVTGFLARTAQASGAGLGGILLRESRLADREFLGLARAVGAQLAERGGWLGIHDRAHLVGPADAHGVHLGFRSLRATEVRSLVGDAIAIGLSTHAGDAPETWAAADYRFFGPVFDTPSKRGLVAAVGPAGLTTSVVANALPVWALGGLQPRNLDTLRSSGVRGVALLAGILGAPDVAQATRAALDSWAGDVSGEGNA
ncbi:MAG: thiamine-phosphate pyrophosphorylase [Chlamydiales bacterium]|jgi:thiamine-phosphate pyrophosphorylase